MKHKEPNEFANEAGKRRVGLAVELWQFIKTNKKWWLLPIVIAILLIGVLVLLSSTGVAPFIYTLF